MCGLNFQVECQDRLRVNSDADEALANGIAEVSEVFAHNYFNFFFSADVTSESNISSELNLFSSIKQSGKMLSVEKWKLKQA